MNPLQILEAENSWSESNRLVSDFVNHYFTATDKPKTVQILEAGCGQQWNLDLDINYKLTGCDLSREALEIRKQRNGDLDDFIVGDLATVSIENNAYDLIYCSYVLEHLNGAEAVLDRFFDWLRAGGLAILIFPDRDSVFGFITRMTPHWFHVFYYKHILKFPNAGLPGYNPFPTAYDPVTSRKGIHQYCRERGHTIAKEFAVELEIPKTRPGLSPLISAGVKSMAAVSFGRLTAEHQNLTLIVQKQ